MSAEATSEVFIGGTSFSEDVPSLTDFAEEAGGAWPAGWYGATIIEGYATSRGKQFVTEDTASKKGDSRNLRVCFSLNGGTLGTRNTFESFNYRVDDLTTERLAQIKELREEFKGVKGAWPGQSDAQRSSLAIAGLGQFTKAIGSGLKRTAEGNIIPTPFVGKTADVRLNIDDKGYNTITAYAPAGTRTKK